MQRDAKGSRRIGIVLSVFRFGYIDGLWIKSILNYLLIQRFMQAKVFVILLLLILLKGNAQFAQKVTFDPLMDFKQNHY